MSLLCAKLANHGDKRIVSSEIVFFFLLLHFSENVALTRLDYQPLFGKGARALLGEKRHESSRTTEIEPKPLRDI